jgi:hypothetical protein
LTSATNSGGKDRGSASAGSVVEAAQAFVEETFAPLRHDGAREVQEFGDLGVLAFFCGQEDELGSEDISIR